MDSSMYTTCSDSEDDEFQEADDFKGTVCTVNVSKGSATPDTKPPDIKKRKIIEEGKQELVTQEDPGKAAKIHQVDHSNAKNYVSKILNPGESQVQKKKNLIEAGQGPASKLAKKSDGPQENQMPCASGGSSTDTVKTNFKPDIKPLLSQFLKWVENNKLESAAEVVNLCTKCNVTFSSPVLLNQHHLKTHSTEDIYDCPDCQKVFPTPGGVIEHRVKMHNAERIYQCSLCDATAKNSSCLNQHHRLCHGLTIKCSECSEEFTSLLLRKQHQWEAHNIGKRLRCVICSETFINFTKFVEHQKNHTFECPVCDMTFNKLVKLRKHEKTHVDSQCIEPVKNNKAVNAGKVPYHCTECNITFSSPALLNQHRQKGHSKARSFKCSDCDRIFSTPGGVTHHRIVVHSAPNIYQCSQCSSIAKSAAFLNNHYKLKHGFSL